MANSLFKTAKQSQGSHYFIAKYSSAGLEFGSINSAKLSAKGASRSLNKTKKLASEIKLRIGGQIALPISSYINSGWVGGEGVPAFA